METKERPYHNTLREPLADGIIFARDETGNFGTNIGFYVETGGSPDGFETGYGGSGPSEFALNLVNEILQAFGPEPESFVKVKNGVVRSDAFQLRHDFKNYTIAKIKLNPGQRYVMPLSLAAATLEICAKQHGLNDFSMDWNRIPGGRESVQDAAEELEYLFGGP